MFNLTQLFPQLSAFGFFGSAPAKHPNPFLALYIDTGGETTPMDLFQTEPEPAPEPDQFLF